MTDDLPSAISGTRRQIRELVDGSLEVRIHIDPRFKQDFHRLFPSIDMPCAIAPLEPGFERLPKPHKNDKPLCKLAGMWPKDPFFLEWLSSKHHGEKLSQEEAEQWIRDVCEVESRSRIDGDPGAEENFHNRIRIPFNNWTKGNK